MVLKIFDPSARRLTIDLDSPFFELRERKPEDCRHENHGVTLHQDSRTATCRKCEAPLDLFEALLIYARAEKRLKNTADMIKAHHDREEEKWARRQELCTCGHARYAHPRGYACRRTCRCKRFEREGKKDMATNNPNPNPPQQPAPQPGTAPTTNPNPAPNPQPKG